MMTLVNAKEDPAIEERKKVVEDLKKEMAKPKVVPEEKQRKFSKEEVTQIVQEQLEKSEPKEELTAKDLQKIIVVTGGAGFIGTHLIKELNDQGREDILLVDDLTDPRKIHNINTLKFQDYADKNKFLELLGFLAENKMIERIYHLGAESSRFCTDGKYLMENNFQYTCNIMDNCHMHNIPLVYASSAAVYGQVNTLAAEDADDSYVLTSFDDCRDNYVPKSFYAMSKLQADRYSRKFMPNHQDRIIGLRYFNVISEGEHEQHKDDMKSALCWMTEQYKKDGEILLYEGSKEIKRDFVHVKEAVRMTINAMRRGSSGIYNIGTGTAKSFYDLAADIVEKDFGSDYTNIKFIPMPRGIAEGYQNFTQANMSNFPI